ncbi:hypothetical protein [Singulisphaera sp. PoT]|uniref:hypothetical protein n=1 Tax=Singulisphaera sp. PoT TaxID=3411797 RepID=UPI003BF53028
MDPAVLELLEASDDPVHDEGDPTLDWPAIHAGVADLLPELERVAGRAFAQDLYVQDASFFTELAIQRPGQEPNWIDTVFAIRFSGFGLLFTTWSLCEVEQLPPEVVEELVATVSRRGFRYIPPADLDAPYTGRHPGFAGSTWWFRFFDYV